MRKKIHAFKTLCVLLGIYMMLLLPLQTTMNVKADYIPATETGEETEEKSEDISEETTEENTEDFSEETTEENPEDSSEVTSEDLSEETSEDASEELLEETSEEDEILTYSDDKEDWCGFIPMPDQEEAECIGISDDSELLKAEKNPVSYDSRDYGRITSVKNQNPYGTCWSFASMAALESSLICEQKADDPDLSEMHFIRYALPDENITDPLGGTDNDSNLYVGSDKMNQGGNITVYYHALANWKGVVDESNNPYPDPEDDPKPVSLADAYSNDIIHVQGCYRINQTDKYYIKQAIMQYGALAGSMGYFNFFYDSDHSAYFADTNYAMNHAVTFIGWDDNYSKENFLEPGEYINKQGETKYRTRPKNDGAWLVKNSWGPNWGDNGYFWMSYEDASLGVFSVLVGESADNYDHNYQYDGSYLSLQASVDEHTITAANVFKVKGREQYLDAISFDSPNAVVNYKVEIYTNIKNPEDPTSGTLISDATVTGKTKFTGYYTVNLPCRIPLIPGNTFSVVVTLQKDTDNVSIYSECTGERRDSAGNVYGKYVAAAKPHQSFLKTSTGWMDYGARYDRNIRIKAFTNDIPDEELVDPFADIEKDNPKWKYDAALYVFNNGYMTGKAMSDDGHVVFSPDTPITRSQFVQVLYSIEGKPEVSYEEIFDDVPDGKWYTSPVIWAVLNDIVTGKGSIFDVDGAANREQIAAIFYKYAIYKELDVSVDPEGKTLDDFTDKDLVSPWAEDALSWAVSRNIISGKGNEKTGYRIDPRGKTTRVECAAILKKFMDIYAN